MAQFLVGETVVIENTRNGNLYLASVVAQHQSEPNIVYIQYPSHTTEHSLIDGDFNTRSRKSRLDKDIIIHIGTDEMIARAEADIEQRLQQVEAERRARAEREAAKRAQDTAEIFDFLDTYGWGGFSDTHIESIARFVRMSRERRERNATSGNS